MCNDKCFKNIDDTERYCQKCNSKKDVKILSINVYDGCWTLSAPYWNYNNNREIFIGTTHRGSTLKSDPITYGELRQASIMFAKTIIERKNYIKYIENPLLKSILKDEFISLGDVPPYYVTANDAARRVMSKSISSIRPEDIENAEFESALMGEVIHCAEVNYDTGEHVVNATIELEKLCKKYLAQEDIELGEKK